MECKKDVQNCNIIVSWSAWPMPKCLTHAITIILLFWVPLQRLTWLKGLSVGRTQYFTWNAHAFVLVRTKKSSKRHNAGLFLFWQRCGTVTECVMATELLVFKEDSQVYNIVCSRQQYALSRRMTWFICVIVSDLNSWWADFPQNLCKWSFQYHTCKLHRCYVKSPHQLLMSFKMTHIWVPWVK